MSETIHVNFHFGAEHVRFDAAASTAVGVLKADALAKLQIVSDPNIDYFLVFEGHTVENETQSLAALLGAHPRPSVDFHIKKRPKGGLS